MTDDEHSSPDQPDEDDLALYRKAATSNRLRALQYFGMFVLITAISIAGYAVVGRVGLYAGIGIGVALLRVFKFL